MHFPKVLHSPAPNSCSFLVDHKPQGAGGWGWGCAPPVASVSPAVPSGRGHCKGQGVLASVCSADLLYCSQTYPNMPPPPLIAIKHMLLVMFLYLPAQEHACPWFLFLVQDFPFSLTSILIFCSPAETPRFPQKNSTWVEIFVMLLSPFSERQDVRCAVSIGAVEGMKMQCLAVFGHSGSGGVCAGSRGGSRALAAGLSL